MTLGFGLLKDEWDNDEAFTAEAANASTVAVVDILQALIGPETRQGFDADEALKTLKAGFEFVLGESGLDKPVPSHLEETLADCTFSNSPRAIIVFNVLSVQYLGSHQSQGRNNKYTNSAGKILAKPHIGRYLLESGSLESFLPYFSNGTTAHKYVSGPLKRTAEEVTEILQTYKRSVEMLLWTPSAIDDKAMMNVMLAKMRQKESIATKRLSAVEAKLVVLQGERDKANAEIAKQKNFEAEYHQTLKTQKDKISELDHTIVELNQKLESSSERTRTILASKKVLEKRMSAWEAIEAAKEEPSDDGVFLGNEWNFLKANPDKTSSETEDTDEDIGLAT